MTDDQPRDRSQETTMPISNDAETPDRATEREPGPFAPEGEAPDLADINPGEGPGQSPGE